jgi:Domain of unknown function (DUF4105)
MIPLALLAATLAAPPRIELYTMGPGDDLFSAFGHAAICVVDERSPRGRCYNYGTADFRTPLPLTWDFIRGRARFWVSVADLPTMLWLYRQEDRSVYRQRLALAPEVAERLAAALDASTAEAVKYYSYHHFDDNCTTRIRDALDRAAGGALHVGTDERGPSYREWARHGFQGHWPLLAVTELFLGRSADRATDRWTAMFLPSELRLDVWLRFDAPPELAYERRAPLERGSTQLGQLAFVLGGFALAILIALGALGGRGAWRASLVPASLVLGLVALVLDALALLSTFPELVRNEALLVFWPTDLALVLLPRPWLRRYAQARLGALALVALGHFAGLTQPLSPLALAALPLATALATL